MMWPTGEREPTGMQMIVSVGRQVDLEVEGGLTVLVL